MMSKLLLVLIFLSTSLIGASQSDTNYFVAYHFRQKTTPDNFPDSVRKKRVEVRMQYGADSTSQTDTTSYPLEQFLGTIDMQVMVYMIANVDSSKTFFEYDEDGTAPTGNYIVSTPDTNFYKNGSWTKLSDGVKKSLPTQYIEVIETKERKNILGYNCIKFVATNSTNENQVTFWASEQLPPTLLPYTGLQKFKYGILEIDHRKDNWHIVATKILKR